MSSSSRESIITIDGPAASGKSSVSRALAQRLGWVWLSTGAFYRGLAYVATEEKTDLNNESALVALAQSSDWEIRMAEEQTLVFYRSKDVTQHIYREDVGAAASRISQCAKVRESLLEAQRACAKGVVGLVAEGRDCGTVVFPQAKVKIYLTAHSENRAVRRAKEEGRSVEETLAAQKVRDKADSTRAAAPLQIPEGALVVDTSELGLNEVIEEVYRLVKSQLS